MLDEQGNVKGKQAFARENFCPSTTAGDIKANGLRIRSGIITLSQMTITQWH